jgi:hypothetical protein
MQGTIRPTTTTTTYATPDAIQAGVAIEVKPIDLLTVFEGMTHIAWAARIARGIGGSNGLVPGGQEVADLISAAHLTLVRLRLAFRPGLVPPGGSADGLFRGWLHKSVRRDVLQELKRLRCHGFPLYRADRYTCLPLPLIIDAGREECPLPDTRRTPDPDAPLDLAELIGRAGLSARQAAALRASRYGADDAGALAREGGVVGRVSGARSASEALERVRQTVADSPCG